MKRSAFIIAFCVGLLAASQNANAQETETGSLSGTGSGVPKLTTQEKAAELELLMKERSIRNREDLVENEESLARLKEDKAAFEKDLAIHREKCRANIRKSNRDTKLSVTLSCYRADLLLQMAFLRKERAYLNQLSGFSKTGRAAIEKAFDDLTDAMTTVVAAIDSDVYSETEDLLSAKKKLGEQYRSAQYLAWEIAKADRMLGWVGVLAQRVRQMSAQPDITEATKTKLDESIVCLQKTASILRSAPAVKTYSETNAFLSQYQSGLANCVESLRSVVRSSRGISDDVKDSPGDQDNAASGTGSTTK